MFESSPPKACRHRSCAAVRDRSGLFLRLPDIGNSVGCSPGVGDQVSSSRIFRPVSQAGLDVRALADRDCLNAPMLQHHSGRAFPIPMLHCPNRKVTGERWRDAARDQDMLVSLARHGNRPDGHPSSTRACTCRSRSTRRYARSLSRSVSKSTTSCWRGSTSLCGGMGIRRLRISRRAKNGSSTKVATFRC